MIVKYEEDLSRQTFLESEQVLKKLGLLEKVATPGRYVVLGSIGYPVAAFDGPGISELPAAPMIVNFFHNGPMPLTTLYDETFNNWNRLQGTWPPSIDTLVHLTGQRRSTILSEA